MSVVVAVDGSAGSVNAIRLASSEAQWRNERLVVIAQTLLRDAIRDALADRSSEVELRVVPGIAGRAIIDAARDEHAQLIVLAARAGISVLPGTVSQYVLRNARCPVMVVPAGRDAG